MNSLKKLVPDTAHVIQKLAKLKLLEDYSFVGGSALTLYFSHRYSEDIDLFTWNKKLNSIEIKNQIEKAGFENIQIINISPTQADFIINSTKVTFFANGWEELKKRKHIKDYLYVANLEIIAVMKVNTLFMRAKFRDYYDLYVLNIEKFTLDELYKMTLVKMKNLSKALFQKAIIFTGDIEDENIKHLAPKHKITLKQIEDHFTKKIKDWNKSL